MLKLIAYSRTWQLLTQKSAAPVPSRRPCTWCFSYGAASQRGRLRRASSRTRIAPGLLFGWAEVVVVLASLYMYQ